MLSGDYEDFLIGLILSHFLANFFGILVLKKVLKSVYTIYLSAMTVRNTIRLIVYRIHEKGLEVLLTKTGGSESCWRLLNEHYNLEFLQKKNQGPFIELTGPDGSEAIAIEADWHDLPGVRQLLIKDLHFMADALKHKLPEIEESAYVAVKEALKKMLPQEYAVLKELKEIILDRNTIRNI
jgi:hypothetical protein